MIIASKRDILHAMREYREERDALYDVQDDFTYYGFESALEDIREDYYSYMDRIKENIIKKGGIVEWSALRRML